ncbi:MAG: T9SS type A sorting domain-containing protein [bacterium]
MRRVLIIIVALTGLTVLLNAHPYFPMDIGKWWRFDACVVDSLGIPIPGTEYTSSSTVVRDTLIAGTSYSVMVDSSNQFGFWEVEEDTYIRAVGDTIKVLMPFFDDTTNWIEVDMAIAPAPIGTTWLVMQMDTIIMDTMGITVEMSVNWMGEITDFGTVVVPAGIFLNSYEIEHNMDFEMTWTSPETTITSNFSSIRQICAALDVGPVRTLQLPFENPGSEIEPGILEELADYGTYTGVGPSKPGQQPIDFRISSVFPNPFNGTTRISYQLPADALVTAVITDVFGREIARPLEVWQHVGVHYLDFSAEERLSSGMYFLHLQAGNYEANQKLVYLK